MEDEMEHVFSDKVEEKEERMKREEQEERERVEREQEGLEREKREVERRRGELQKVMACNNVMVIKFIRTTNILCLTDI